MLKKILSVSGKPGLYKLISQGKNMYVVESIVDGKRMPTYPRDKVVSLGDIAIYTSAEEVPLADVFTTMMEKEKGKTVSLPANAQPEQLRKFFAEILPDFDREKVYPSDVKKMVNWYNMLITAGITDFKEKEEEKTEEPEAAKENESAEQESVK